MTGALLTILIAGVCTGAWAVLSVLGGERQRLLAEMENNRARFAAAVKPSPAPPTTKPSGKPTKSSSEAKQVGSSSEKRPQSPPSKTPANTRAKAA